MRFWVTPRAREEEALLNVATSSAKKFYLFKSCSLAKFTKHGILFITSTWSQNTAISVSSVSTALLLCAQVQMDHTVCSTHCGYKWTPTDKRKAGAREGAQSIKCLQGFDLPEPTFQKPGVVVQACNASAGEMETGT